MSLDSPGLQELAAAAPAPEGVPPAIAVIAGSDIRALDGALITTGIGTEKAESDLQAAEEIYSILTGHEENIQINSQAVKERVAGQLQDIIREMHEAGEVPPPELLDDLMLLQEEGSSVIDMTGPKGEFETDDELRAKVDKAVWDRFVRHEKLETARADLDAARERVQTVGLAKEIKTVRRKLSNPMRYASTLLCTVVLGAGATGLVYKAETMSNKNAVEITRETNRKYPDHRERVPSLALDANERFAVGAFGTLGLFVGGLAGMWAGEGLSGRTARWRARRIVKKAEMADTEHPEEQPEE